MDWADTIVQTVQFGKLIRVPDKNQYKVTHKPYEVPAVYHRLICQLTAEEDHGKRHNSHESRRRQMYARQVLDALAEEIITNQAQPPERRISPTFFRSHILTPILQRQLRAVHDAYMPSVHTAMIRKGEDSLTISRVTEIYLHQDPTLAHHIPRYRRHLLYVPEPRWYLGILVNPGRVGDADFYNTVRQHHEEILMAIREEKGKGKECDEGRNMRDPYGMPLLRRAEVRAIVLEGLEDLFAQELTAVVLYPIISMGIPGTDHHCVESTTG